MLASVDKMTSKGFTTKLLIISLIILVYSITNYIKFPIKIETKRSLGYPKDSLLNFTELTTKYGYFTEEHSAVTEDGYVLKIFRIVRGRKCKGKTRLPPVVLMHGLLQSSDAFLDAGPKSGLAYLISDACYDLWVANCRGNYYSRSHVELNPDKDEEFWKFSVDEIGLYDVPAVIDYVLEQTGVEKLNYIGYSQGAGSFMIMCSEKPGYCDKVNVLIALAPATRQTHTKSVVYRLITQSIYKLEGTLSKYGVQEVFSKGDLSQEFLAFFCQLNTITEKICAVGQSLLDSFHDESITNNTRRNLFGHFPAGTSLHNMARYGQSMMSEDFTKFDYGENNIKVYGSDQPPLYNLSAVSVPVVAIYGKNDGMVDVEDVEWLIKRLPNVVDASLVKDPYWTHFDVTYSQYTRELIFPKIKEHLLRYNYNRK